MRACVVHGAGDLRVEEVPGGTLSDADVEVAVNYGGICGSDLHYWHLAVPSVTFGCESRWC